jgi:transcriptional regulator with XRE-family HTH domain
MGTRKKITPQEAAVIHIVSTNVRNLMRSMDWSEHDLAKKSGVSQKAINNLLNKTTGCTITTADKLAKPFGLTGWQLMLEKLPVDAAFGSTLTQIMVKILGTDPKGRDWILNTIARV